LAGSDRGITRLALSSDGTKLVSGGNDRGILVWNTHNWKIELRLMASLGRVTNIALSSNGKLLASASGKPSEQQDVTIWELPSGNVRQVRHMSISVFTFTPDNSQLIIGAGNTILIWDMLSDTGLHEFDTRDDPIGHIMFTHDGRFICLCSDKVVKVSAAGKNNLQERRLPDGSLGNLSSEGSHVPIPWPFGTPLDGFTWRRVTLSFAAYATNRQEPDFASEKTKWWVHVARYTICIYDSNPEGKQARLLLEFQLLGSYFVISLCGTKAIEMRRREWNVWDIQSGRLERAIDVAPYWVTDIAVLHDGTVITADATIKLWEMGTPEVFQEENEVEPGPSATKRIDQVAVSPNGREVAVLLECYMADRWDFAPLDLLAFFTFDGDPIVNMVFSGDSSKLALSSKDYILVRDIVSAKADVVFRSTYEITLPDGRNDSGWRAVSLSTDGTKIAWVDDGWSQVHTENIAVLVGSVQTGQVIHSTASIRV
jgi:WD40 repeat protein